MLTVQLFPYGCFDQSIELCGPSLRSVQCDFLSVQCGFLSVQCDVVLPAPAEPGKFDLVYQNADGSESVEYAVSRSGSRVSGLTVIVVRD
jgi:hypothetical protein